MGGGGGIRFCASRWMGSEIGPAGEAMGLGEVIDVGGIPVSFHGSGLWRCLSCSGSFGEVNVVGSGGGGGSALLRSFVFCLDNRPGASGAEDEANDGVKSENDTICGCLGVTNLPCRCFGGGGFCFLSGFCGSSIKPNRSSSSDLVAS
jgi:hypothetical protein